MCGVRGWSDLPLAICSLLRFISPYVPRVYCGSHLRWSGGAPNANGEAEVMLPAYFEALNRHFRYQFAPGC